MEILDSQLVRDSFRFLSASPPFLRTHISHCFVVAVCLFLLALFLFSLLFSSVSQDGITGVHELTRRKGDDSGLSMGSHKHLPEQSTSAVNTMATQRATHVCSPLQALEVHTIPGGSLDSRDAHTSYLKRKKKAPSIITVWGCSS